MELIPTKKEVRLFNTHRLIPSCYPTKGILDEITTPEDLKLIWELESWTNDRINAQLGLLNRIPDEEWVLSPVSNATIIMAAFCHPSPEGGRFNTSFLGACYSSFDLETAIKETAYHRHKEFTEVGKQEGHVCMRQYLSDFNAEFHDIRDDFKTWKDIYDPDSYKASQEFSEFLKKIGSNGTLYNSVRLPKNYCIVSFRPTLVQNVQQGSHFNYYWDKQGYFKAEEIKT